MRPRRLRPDTAETLERLPQHQLRRRMKGRSATISTELSKNAPTDCVWTGMEREGPSPYRRIRARDVEDSPGIRHRTLTEVRLARKPQQKSGEKSVRKVAKWPLGAQSALTGARNTQR